MMHHLSFLIRRFLFTFLFRVRFLPRDLKRKFLSLSRMMQVLGFGTVAVLTATVKLWKGIPRTFWEGISPLLQTIIVLVIIYIALYALCLWLMKMFMGDSAFAFATRRLNDKASVAQRGNGDNPEAKYLLTVLSRGREKSDAYQFLCDLWSPLLEPPCGLSLLRVPSASGDISLPIARLNLPLSSSTPGSLDRLSTILRLDRRSRYKNYSILEDGDDLKPRDPRPRYLNRFKGPSEDQTGFRDDYVGLNACLNKLTVDNGKVQLPLACNLELYGNIMDSCDILIPELYLYFALKGGTNHPTEILRCLPWRQEIHRAHEDSVSILTQPKTRAVGIGVSCLTVFNNEGKFVAVIGKRTTQVGTYREVHHVIPAGMTNVDMEGEGAETLISDEGNLNIRLLVEKEFLEEVFSESWASRLDVSPGKWPSLVREKCEKHLYGERGRYRTEVCLSGIAFDLLTYRPEICVLILIRNPEWWKDHRRFGEANLSWKLSYEWNEKVRTVDISDAKASSKVMSPENSVVAGVAAYHLGLDLAREKIRDE